jgi:hypothetical protein
VAIVRSGKKNKSILFQKTTEPLSAPSSQNNNMDVEDDRDNGQWASSESEVEEEKEETKQRKEPKEKIVPQSQSLRQPTPTQKTKVLRSQTVASQVVEFVEAQSEQKKKKKFVIAFTGFIPGTEFDIGFRNELSAYVEQLNGTVMVGDTFDGEITHVVAPANCRTMKTLIASLTQRWVISPDWILDSLKENKFISERSYGNRQKTNVFNDKDVFISSDFATTNLNYQLDNFRTLIEKLGKGTIVNKAFGADIILVPTCMKHNYHNLGAQCLTWKQFFNHIQPIDD